MHSLTNMQPILDRGYTGHEHMAGFGLINMNGRLYDPYLQRFLSPDPYVQEPGNAQNYNRYAYCLNNPLVYTDPDGEFIITAFLIGVAVSAIIDYGIQVAMNYSTGERGADAWFNKVDFFDVAVSGAIGGLTAGWGASLKAGHTVSKFGLLMVKNAKYVKAGEILLTSAVDITGEGWQDVSFKQFGQRAATGLATMAATDYISSQFKKSVTPSIEQRVDYSIEKATGTTVLGHYPDYVNLSNELGANRFEIPSEIWNKMTPSEQWTANQRFLDRMVLRGDKVRLATPISKVRPGSFLEKELNYLFSLGYKLSPNGLWLAK